MNMNIKKIFVFLALLACFSMPSFAAKTWTQIYEATPAGTQVWSSEGPFTRQNAALSQRFPVAGGVNVVTDVVPKLKNGVAVPLSVVRLATPGNLFKAARILSGGPLGLASLLAQVPSIFDWVAGDNAQHIRTNAARDGFEIKDPAAPVRCMPDPPAPDGYANEPLMVSKWACHVMPSGVAYWGYERTFDGVKWPFEADHASIALAPDWLPASMDDIAPYMTPRLPPPAMLDQVLATGTPVDSVPQSLTTKSTSEISTPPYAVTSTFAAPAPVTTTEIALGNPFNLPHNTPVVTNRSVSVAPLYSPSTTTTGPLPDGVTAPVPVTSLSTPVKIETTSIYDPASNQTTSTTVKTQDAAKAVSTTTNVTNIVNNITTSTVTNIYNTTNTTTDTTTNTPLSPDTSNSSQSTPKASDTPDPCLTYPDRLGCIELGDPPTPEKIENTKYDVTVIPKIFASSSACPPPIPITAFGRNYSLSYQPACDRLATIKVLFLALAGFLAAYILADSFKVT